MNHTLETTPGAVTRVSDVEKQLSALWAEVSAQDEDSLIRATTLNLVMYTETPDAAILLGMNVLADHPGRLIIVAVEETEGEAISAEPTIVCKYGFGRVQRAHVCGEQIVLRVGRDGLDKAANAVQSLLIPDQPTYLFWHAEFDLQHPLLLSLDRLSGGLIVDSEMFADPDAGLRTLAQYTESHTFHSNIYDLNWERLLPYCITLANGFDSPTDREALRTIRSVEITHQDSRARSLLLLGWLADRLGWRVAPERDSDSWVARVEGLPAKDNVISLKLGNSINPDTTGGARSLTQITISAGSRTYRLTADQSCLTLISPAGQSVRALGGNKAATLLDRLLNGAGDSDVLFTRALNIAALFSEESISKHAGIVIVEDANALNRMAARKFTTIGRAAISRRDRFTIALSGGTTPKALYELIATSPFKTQLDWSKVHLFWGDERDVPPDHAASNQRMVREALINHLPIPAVNVHELSAGKFPAREAAQLYSEHIRRFFNLKAGEQPEFDLILLGIGDDGHTASLFPHTEALNAPAESIFVANPIPQLETTRLTLTYAAINNAANILVLVSGAKKADILARVLHGAYRPDDYPIQRVNLDGGLFTLIADQAAASKLR